VWHIHVNSDWDEWDLVSVFCLAEGSSAQSPCISRFSIPLNYLGLSDAEERVAYEFWSGQFVGTVPGGRNNVGGYQHPGDFQELASGGSPSAIEIAFFGPSVKLLCLRRTRKHPWVVGTSFHQSCGLELRNVVWDTKTATLRGTVHRPAGESGSITVVSNGMKAVGAQTNNITATLVAGAKNTLVLPLTMSKDSMSWSIRFETRTDSHSSEKLAFQAGDSRS
jgi:hypothetical protein